MANDSFSQQALAKDLSFILRLQAALSKIAWVVLTEATNTPNHIQRATFARQIVSNPAGFAQTYAPWFVMRTNVFSFTTSAVFNPILSVITAAGDADIEAQLTSDWNILSGV
jgi:hypothetical protein